MANLKRVRLKLLLVDPRAEMRLQKSLGNTETLVDYEKIGLLAQQASDLYSNYLASRDVPGLDISAGELVDLDVLGNIITHDHTRVFELTPQKGDKGIPIRGTRRQLKSKMKEDMKK